MHEGTIRTGPTGRHRQGDVSLDSGTGSVLVLVNLHRPAPQRQMVDHPSTDEKKEDKP